MVFLSTFARLCLLYSLVLTDKRFSNATEPLSSSSSSSPSSSSSFSSFVIQKTTTTKACTNTVLVPEEALKRLQEMANVTIKDLQSLEPEEAPHLHVGKSVRHLPSMTGLIEEVESCNHRLLLTLWESEDTILHLRREINKQKEENNKYKEELDRAKEEMEQVRRDCHPNPHRHRHHRLHHQQEQLLSLPVDHPLSIGSDSTTILRSDLQDMKEVLLDAIIDMRNNGRSDHQDIKESILDAVIDMRENGIECNKNEPQKQKEGWPPKDCSDLFALGERKSSVYNIYPFKGSVEAQGIRVWCDMGEKVGEGEVGGWTIILQRRFLPQPLLFNRTWEDYKNGFGNPDKEYWIGNDVLHQLTALGKPQALRVDMEDFDGVQKFASYGMFSVGGEEDNYRLTVGMFSNMSSVAADSLDYHNGWPFSTVDRDNDDSPRNCAAEYGRGGFWMRRCHHTNPTAPIRGKGNNNREMTYYGFKNDRTTLKELTMKIKPSG